MSDKFIKFQLSSRDCLLNVARSVPKFFRWDHVGRFHSFRSFVSAPFHVTGEFLSVSTGIVVRTFILALPSIMRQHPTSTNVIDMFVLDFEVVNWGGAGAG